MKYAFFIFSFFIFSQSSFARSINSFSDSQALSTIAEFMMDSASDSISSKLISDKKIKIKDGQACTLVNANDVIKAVESAINTVLRLYPDEELPVEEAISDLRDYLQNKTYHKCSFFQTKSHSSFSGEYFVDSSDKIHVKVDTVIVSLE